MNIAVLGAGSMACAMGAHLGRQDCRIKLWSKFLEEAEKINL
jgi:glycerol-3-phosphate dehydrogenase